MNIQSWRVLRLNIILGLLLFISIGYAYVWQQLVYKSLSIAEQATFIIAPGTSLQQFTRQLHTAGIVQHPKLLNWYARVKGYANTLKAGEYKLLPGTSAAELLRTVVAGKVIQHAFTIIEGWRSADVMRAMQTHPKIKITLGGLTPQEIIQRLNIPVAHLEGIFLPDTYYFTANTTDAEFLRRAYFSMQRSLQAAWNARSANTVLKSPYEALILASIIEKESGIYAEYPEISGVFQRRLARKMRLQADPTVIYALGSAYTGQLSKRHLRFNSPYNTYTQFGLPPTPIAIPSLHALHAALHPASGNSLYFVANGAGMHVFSKDLVAHNKAVQKK